MPTALWTDIVDDDQQAAPASGSARLDDILAVDDHPPPPSKQRPKPQSASLSDIASVETPVAHPSAPAPAIPPVPQPKSTANGNAAPDGFMWEVVPRTGQRRLIPVSEFQARTAGLSTIVNPAHVASVAAGVRELGTPGKRVEGAADLVEGAMGLGTPFLAEGLSSLPALTSTITGLISGMGAQQAVDYLGEKYGVDHQWTRLASALTGLAVGGVVGAETHGKTEAIAEQFRTGTAKPPLAPEPARTPPPAETLVPKPASRTAPPEPQTGTASVDDLLAQADAAKPADIPEVPKPKTKAESPMAGGITPVSKETRGAIDAIGSTGADDAYVVTPNGQKFKVQQSNYGTFGRTIGGDIRLADGSDVSVDFIAAVEDASGKTLWSRKAPIVDIPSEPAPSAPSNTPHAVTPPTPAHEASAVLTHPADAQPGSYYTVDPKLVKADPQRFQFKSNADESGVTTTAKIDGPWNENRAGTLLTWKDPETGELFVVNGHHRLDAAIHTGAPRVSIKVLEPMSSGEALLEGAMTNIAEDKASPVDVARVIRARGYSSDDLRRQGVNPNSGVAKQGRALANLSDPLFVRVAQEELDPALASAIGEANLTPEGQKAVVDLVDRQAAKGRELTPRQLKALIEDVQSAPEVEGNDSQGDIFGLLGDTRKENLAIERATHRDWLAQKIASDKRMYKWVSNEARAEKLAETGNVLQTGANRERASEAGIVEAVFTKLAQSKGPVSDALNRAAERTAAGEKESDVRADLHREVTVAVQAELQRTPTGGVANGADRPGQSGSQHPEAPAGGSHPETGRAAVDTLATGESQSRLPGDVGAVRDVEVPDRPVADVPEQSFDLTGPPETDPNQGTLYGGFNVPGLSPMLERIGKAFSAGWQEAPPPKGGPRPTLPPIDAPEPVQGRLAIGRGKVPDKAGNISLDKFDWPDEAKIEFADMVEDQGEFMGQRRGVRSWEATRTAAEAIPVTKSVPKAGKAANAEELEALAGHLDATRQQMDVVTKRILETPPNTPERSAAVAQQAVLQTQFHVLAETYAGHTAEAGRALNILRKLRTAIDTRDMKLIKAAIDQLGGEGKIADIARLLSQFAPDDLIGKYRFVNALAKPKAADYLSWYWYTNLLSGPSTHIKNFTGNMSEFTFNMLSRPLAAGADVVRSLVTNTPREVFLDESALRWVGAREGALQGAKKAGFMLRNGFTMDDVANLEFRPPEVFGGAMLPNFIGRALASADTFARSMNAMSELYAQAFASAKKAGLDPNTAIGKAHVAEFLANPPKQAMEIMAREGARAVFQQDNAMADFIAKGKNDFQLRLPSGRVVKVFNLLKLVVPFIKTPANIMANSMEATPLGAVTAAFRKTPREQSLAYGRAALGTMLLTPLAFLAAEGRVSGTGPKDKELRDQLYRNGWQPNSVRIGDKWYQYSNIQPLALPLSVIANIFEAYQYEGQTPNMGQVVSKTASSVLNQSFLSGLSMLQSALEDETGNKWNAMFKKTATSALPLSSLTGQIARAADPVVRQPETIGESFKTNEPGLSQSVRPRLTAFGEPSTRGGALPNERTSFFWRLLSPIPSSQIKDTPLERELFSLRNEIQIGFPAKTMVIAGQKLEFTPDEYDELQRKSGQAIKKALEAMTSHWRALPSELKADQIKATVDRLREAVRDQMAPAVLKRVAAAKKKP